ncbi:hypothetical protein HDU85_007240 [Gaertneriomyces sp. JEL0708]|nr:hypothetical protein HDU85_007240 [Gaertneriomyces sp. JEL0708]
MAERIFSDDKANELVRYPRYESLEDLTQVFIHVTAEDHVDEDAFYQQSAAQHVSTFQRAVKAVDEDPAVPVHVKRTLLRWGARMAEKSRVDSFANKYEDLQKRFRAADTYGPRTVHFIFKGANISKWVRDSQHHLFQQCRAGKELMYKDDQIADVLLLNHVLLLGTQYLPSFIMETRNKKIRDRWREVVAEHQLKNLNTSLPERTAIKLLGFLNTLKLKTPFDDVWVKHLSSGADDMKFVKAMHIVRSFYFAVHKARRYRDHGISLNEDTVIHDILHSLLEETFTDDRTVTVWANGSSNSSKLHRRHYLPKAMGKKPDGRVLSAEFEEVFMEGKSRLHADTSPAALYDLFKLAIFVQGSLNEKSKQVDDLDLALFAEDTGKLTGIFRKQRQVDEALIAQEGVEADSDDWDLHLSSPPTSPLICQYEDFTRVPVPTPARKGSGIPAFLRSRGPTTDTDDEDGEEGADLPFNNWDGKTDSSDIEGSTVVDEAED